MATIATGADLRQRKRQHAPRRTAAGAAAAISYLQATPLASDPRRLPAAADPDDRRRQLLGLRLRRDVPGFPDHQLHRHARLVGHLEDLSQHAEIRRHRLGADALHRLLGRLFPRLPHPHDGHADGAVPGLHRAVPDLQHHPHDLVDPGARPQRPGQLDAGRAGHRPGSRSNGCSIPISPSCWPWCISTRCSW